MIRKIQVNIGALRYRVLYMGKVYCKILNKRLVEHLDREEYCMKVRRALEILEAVWGREERRREVYR